MDDGFRPDERPNWRADERFQAAFAAADATHTTDQNHRAAICEALRLTLQLVEGWRDGHQQAISNYLAKNAPKDDADINSVTLSIVKCVFARQDKKQWTWHANALRQANADGKTSDDLTAYFKAKPPTKAAQQWSKDHRRPSAPRAAPVEITFPLPWYMPKVAKIGEKGMMVKLTLRDGKPFLAIPQKALSKAAEPPKPPKERATRKPTRQREQATA
jgi:hypothetical protein